MAIPKPEFFLKLLIVFSAVCISYRRHSNLFRHRYNLFMLNSIRLPYKLKNSNAHQIPEDSYVFEKESNYLRSLNLISWGSFKNESMDLKSSPAFIAITGKSGTGKSVLLSAFEYLMKLSSGNSGASSREIFSQFNDSEDSEATISLQRGDDEYKRVFNVQSKKSVCFVNGKKTTIKSFAPEMPIRFWFRDSIKYLGSGEKGVINYINTMTLFSELSDADVATAYNNWVASIKEVKHLESFENMNQLESMQLSVIRHFVDEVDSLYAQVSAVFESILDALESLQSFPERSSPLAKTDVDSVKESESHSIAALIQSVSELIKSTENGIESSDLRLSWSTLLRSDKLMSELCAVYERLLPSTVAAAVNKHGSASSAFSNKNIPFRMPQQQHQVNMSPISSAIDGIQSQLEALEMFQNKCTKLGLYSITVTDSVESNDSFNNLFKSLESVYDCLAESKSLLKSAKASLNDFQENWPDLHAILSDIAKVRSTWEALSRKHNSPPGELGSKYFEWIQEINQFDNLETLLPLKRQEEKLYRMQYARLASERTVLRVEAASKLVKFLNQLLPSLEMADKRIAIEHSFYGCIDSSEDSSSSSSSSGNRLSNTHIDVEMERFGDYELTTDCVLKGMADRVQPAEGVAMETGWDDFKLQVRVYSNKVSSSKLSVDTLSSGEKSRLALALETCCINATVAGKQSAGAGSDSSTPQGGSRDTGNGNVLVVFDELDAHVGGEAAVAIARLLKRQGKYRQIIAVTHNPVLAAAADVHYMVSRPVATVASTGSSFHSALTTMMSVVNSPLTSLQHEPATDDNQAIATAAAAGSTVAEVTGKSREGELARMVTGTIDASKSLELARQLLSYDFSL